MGRGEFEEILEECLSALLEGRRSIEESLSLYPAWRGRLEPLLRAADEIAAGLDEVPPPYVKERGLQRFLEAAQARRRLRQLLPLQAERTSWWHWAPTGLGVAAVIAVLALISVTLLAEDGRGLSRASVSVSPYTAADEAVGPSTLAQSPLERAQKQVSVLEDSVRDGEPIEVALLKALEEASSALAADLGRLEDVGLMERVTAVSVANRQYELLQKLQGESSGEQAQAIEAGLAAAGDVLERLGATPTPEASPTPEPTVSPSPTPSPSFTVDAEFSPTPTE